MPRFKQLSPWLSACNQKKFSITIFKLLPESRRLSAPDFLPEPNIFLTLLLRDLRCHTSIAAYTLRASTHLFHCLTSPTKTTGFSTFVSNVHILTVDTCATVFVTEPAGLPLLNIFKPAFAAQPLLREP